MVKISFILGIIGNVISILMFASPIKTFKEVVKKKSTENYKGLPYITTLLSTSLWSFYGLLKTDGLLVVTVNAAGAALHVIYVTLFLIYAPQIIKIKSVKLVVVVNIVFLGGVILITLVAIRGHHLRLTLVGILCAGLTVGMYAAPLTAMRTVIKTKSVKYMPFLLTFFQFLNGGIWTAYSVLIKDFYIGIPNGIGFVLSMAQLILYMIYRNKSAEESEEKKEEEGSAHLVRGGIQMQGFNKNDEETNVNKRSLSRGNSLPKPSRAPQYNQNIKKTSSLTPDEMDQLTEKDLENGPKETQ